MLVCPGCGGRNPPDLDVCAFCNRRVNTRANGSRARRPRRLVTILLTTLLLAVLISVVLLVLARQASLA